MANAELLYETFDAILANAHAWDQKYYINGDRDYDPANPLSEDCGTTVCIAGMRGLMDRLKPMPGSCSLFTDPVTGRLVFIEDHARERFELTDTEQDALFEYFTRDLTKFKARIDEIVAGEWRDRQVTNADKYAD